jgi:exopolysaccharide production protein ExoQ
MPAGRETLLVFAFLLLSTGAFLNLQRPDSQVDQSTGNLGFQVLWGLCYLASLKNLVFKVTDWRDIVRRQWSLFLLIALAISSTLWSDVAQLTFRRSIALLGTCLFGIYIGARFRVPQQLRILVFIIVTTACASYCFGILDLGTPVDAHEGAWFGVFMHKNNLGRMMVLGALVISCYVKRGNHLFIAFGMSACIGLVLLSRSTTSILILSLLLVAIPVSVKIVKAKRARTLLLCLVAASIFLGHWTIGNLTELTEFFGKDITLTGRLYIWVASISLALGKPWLGYGYNAFWLGHEGPSAVVLKLARWDVPHAHNALLDVWLELGLLGVLLLLVAYFSYLQKAIILMRTCKTRESTWPFLYLIFMALANITESVAFKQNSVFWIMFVAVGTRVTIDLRDSRGNPGNGSLVMKTQMGDSRLSVASARTKISFDRV